MNHFFSYPTTQHSFSDFLLEHALHEENAQTMKLWKDCTICPSDAEHANKHQGQSNPHLTFPNTHHPMFNPS